MLDRKHKIGVNYTAQELADLYGADWKKILGLERPRLPQKPPIHRF